MNQYIKSLDGWRAIAVILVIFSHMKEVLFIDGSLLFKISAWGLNGVDLFFAISGYLISKNLISELKISNTINLKKFYLKRVFRLMPVLWINLLVLYILTKLGWIVVSSDEFLSTLTFWRNYLSTASSHYTGQMWSLSVEEHFYFFLPLFLYFIRKSKNVILFSLAIALTVTIWRKLGTMPVIIEQFPLIEFNMWATFGRFDSLLYGVILAFLDSFYSDKLTRLKKISPFVVVTILTIVYVLPIPLKPTFEAILFPLLIYSTISNEDNIISKILEYPFLTYIGKLSYSIYIWHMLFAYKMPSAPTLVQIIFGNWFSIIPIFLISAFSFRFIETPIRTWGYSMIKKWVPRT